MKEFRNINKTTAKIYWEFWVPFLKFIQIPKDIINVIRCAKFNKIFYAKGDNIEETQWKYIMMKFKSDQDATDYCYKTDEHCQHDYDCCGNFYSSYYNKNRIFKYYIIQITRSRNM